jgi:D-alanyl-D-alanine carboxypeptidase/D-alanyl-D-alanine-endopeptidase (penicillin-binding protein 4)
MSSTLVPSDLLAMPNLLLLLLLAPATQAATLTEEVAALAGGNGLVYVVDAEERVVVNLRGSVPTVPASTLKVVTTVMAGEVLGYDTHFRTHFWVEGGMLVVRGEGDPLLVSEELDTASRAIGARLSPDVLARGLDGVAIDDSYFEGTIDIPGVGDSLEPYDAINTATAVNFNTINVRWKDGRYESAEPQTPMTPLAEDLARRKGIRGELRFNLSSRPADVRRYAGELIAAKLRAAGVKVGAKVTEGRAPATEPLYTHENSKTVADTCQAMLRFSNNYIANQVFLAIGARVEGAPASLARSVRVARAWLAERPDLAGVEMHEGSGISYDNRVTGPAMAAALRRIEPRIDLLREKNGTPSKTGTLKVAKTVAGFIDTASHGRLRFVILLDGGGSERRWKIVDLLKARL